MRIRGSYFALIVLIMLCGLAALMINTDKPQTPERIEYNGYRAQDMIVPIPKDYKRPTPTPTPKPNKTVLYYENVLKGCYLDKIPLLIVELDLTYIGRYFVTAYSPQETGSWQTASGIDLHRAEHYNRYTDPTTCAIDPALHSFGELFYIEEFDRVFIAEDTGGLIKGRKIDLGYTDLESVYTFPTGYYDIYAVEYVYSLKPAVKYDVRPIISKYFIEEAR